MVVVGFRCTNVNCLAATPIAVVLHFFHTLATLETFRPQCLHNILQTNQSISRMSARQLKLTSTVPVFDPLPKGPGAVRGPGKVDRIKSIWVRRKAELVCGTEQKGERERGRAARRPSSSNFEGTEI